MYYVDSAALYENHIFGNTHISSVTITISTQMRICMYQKTPNIHPFIHLYLCTDHLNTIYCYFLPRQIIQILWLWFVIQFLIVLISLLKIHSSIQIWTEPLLCSICIKGKLNDWRDEIQLESTHTSLTILLQILNNCMDKWWKNVKFLEN